MRLCCIVLPNLGIGSVTVAGSALDHVCVTRGTSGFQKSYEVLALERFALLLVKQNNIDG